MADVEALMTAYEQVVAERSAVYAELSGLVIRVEAARQRCHDQGESAPGAPETEFARLIVGDLEAGA
jgi:hypothetical protein